MTIQYINLAKNTQKKGLQLILFVSQYLSLLISMLEKFGGDRSHSFFSFHRQSLTTKRGLRCENGARVPGGQRPHLSRELSLKTSTRTLPLIPNRQTIEGGARKQHKTLTGRTGGDRESYR